jgi:prevent-host-death family protein
MKTVNVARLKNQLSLYLRYVRKGEPVLIRDRNNPIAKIVPLELERDEDTELASLIASGILKLPDTPGGTPSSFYKLPRTRLVKKDFSAMIREDRDER